MKIIILGAGQVGGTLAENLTTEDNDITIVDMDPERLRYLQHRLDLRTVCGPASHPDTLEKAGAVDADMLIAVTSNDEVNMVACQVGYTIFNISTKIARIRSQQYFSHAELFCSEALPVDFFISPEQIVTNNVQHLIEYPGSLQVLDFAMGQIQLVGLRPMQGGPLVGKALTDIWQLMPDSQVKLVAVYRGERSIPVNAETTIENNDEIFFIAHKKTIRDMMQAFGRFDNPNRKIMVAGGGNIGYCLSKALEEKYQIKIIEHGQERTHYLADKLTRSTVLLGDAADKDLLLNENIEDIDVFCAVTNDDEANIMSALLAKQLGARTVMALITRPAYVDLIEGGPIDIVISPQQFTIGSILAHIRRGDIVRVHSLRRGAAEAIEAVAHGDKKTSKVVGRKVNEIKLPQGVSIGALVRDNDQLIVEDESIVEAGDHVILFVEDKKRIRDVEKLFQVSATFF